MIAITTSSSIRVKPSWIRRLPISRSPSPVTVRNCVQALRRGQRVDIEDVVARLRIIRRTLEAAQPPGFLGSHGSVRKKRITRYPAQKVEVDFFLARLILHPDVQRFQIRR